MTGKVQSDIDDIECVLCQAKSDKPPRKFREVLSTTPFLVGAGLTIGVSAVLWPFISPALRKVPLPFIPAVPGQIASINRAINQALKTDKACKHLTKDSCRIIDLGSGSGAVIYGLRKENFKVLSGVELNIWLVLMTKIKSLFSSSSKPYFYRGNILDHRIWQNKILPQNDFVVLYGVPSLMPEIIKLLQKSSTMIETKPGGLVVCYFDFPNSSTRKEPMFTVGSDLTLVKYYPFSAFSTV